MSDLRVWWDADADGGHNMAADECLALEAGRRGGMLVRIYGWRSAAVSLGCFQRIDEARAVAEIAGLPLVRRPSGGGAIVHGSDLTYAAAVPRGHPWAASPQRLYDALHGAMVAVLAEFGLAARLCPGGVDRVARPAEEDSFFCFDRRSAGDIVVETRGPRPTDAKVMGSAQRRLAGVVLQHGSLLLRGNPAVTGRAHHAGLAEMPGFAAAPPDSRLLPRRWLERVAADLGVGLVEDETFSLVAADELKSLTGRFLDPAWNERR